MLLRRRGRREEHDEPTGVAARWEALRLAEPELAQGVALQRTVQRLQRQTALRPMPPPFEVEAARDRLLAGVPLLQGAATFVELAGVRLLVQRLCREAVRGEALAEARSLLDALERGGFDLAAAVRAACALDTEALTALLANLGERAAVAATILHYALAPGFRAAADAYASIIDEAPWDRGVCPVCAAAPLLGEFRGGESRRVLRCGRCGAAWNFQRLRCVFCDTHDHRQLSYLQVEGEPGMLRIEVCDSCSGYIKSLARLDPIPYDLLAAEDLATAHLDLLALERGYGRPGAGVGCRVSGVGLDEGSRG